MTHIISRKQVKYHKSKGIAVLSVLITVSVLCLGILYIFQTNSLVSCSYKIREQKKHLEELEADNHRLEMQAAQLRSPVVLEKMVVSLGMVEVENAVYLTDKSAVALKSAGGKTRQ